MDAEDAEHDPPLEGDCHASTVSVSWRPLNPLALRMSSPPPGGWFGPFETAQPVDYGIETPSCRVVQQSETLTINPEVLIQTRGSSGSPSASLSPSFDTGTPATSSVDSTWDFQDGLNHGLHESPVGSPQACPI